HLPLGFFFSSRRRHTRSKRDWSSDVCSSDLHRTGHAEADQVGAMAQIAQLLLRTRLPDAVGHRGQPVAEALMGALVGVEGAAAEIGRASCRERVWGEGVGGGVSEREVGKG